MAQVEGVARTIDPKHDIWEAARPVVERWVAREFGPEGAVKTAQSLTIGTIDRLKRLPEIMDRFESALVAMETTSTQPQPTKEKANLPLLSIVFLCLALALGFALGLSDFGELLASRHLR